MGAEANRRISEERGLFPPFSGFSRCSPGLPEKGRKRQKKGEKGRFRPISRTGGQTPLKPPFVTPPFAAAQSFSGHLGLFRHFFDTPGRDARGHLFETFWGFRAQRPSRLLYMAAPIAKSKVSPCWKRLGVILVQWSSDHWAPLWWRSWRCGQAVQQCAWHRVVSKELHWQHEEEEPVENSVHQRYHLTSSLLSPVQEKENINSVRRRPDYSSNLCPPKIWSIWHF